MVRNEDQVMRNTKSLHTSLAVTAQRTLHSPEGLFRPSPSACTNLQQTLFSVYTTPCTICLMQHFVLSCLTLNHVQVRFSNKKISKIQTNSAKTQSEIINEKMCMFPTKLANWLWNQSWESIHFNINLTVEQSI